MTPYLRGGKFPAHPNHFLLEIFSGMAEGELLLLAHSGPSPQLTHPLRA